MNSYEGYATPLRLELKPSKRLHQIVTAAYLATITTLMWAPTRWHLGLVLSLLLTFLLLRYLRRTKDHTTLVWYERLRWHHQAFPEDTFVLLPGITVHPLLVSFTLHNSKRSIPIVILSDMADTDTFRRLRIRLQQTRFDSQNP